jgi:hypothetical protein
VTINAMAPHTLTNSEKIQNLTVKPKNHCNPLLGQEGATSRQFVASRRHCQGCCLLRDAEETASGCSNQAERNGDAWSLLTARATQELLQSFKWEVLAHPPHSPDLAPSDYHLVTKLKESLAGKTFSDDGEVQDAVITWLKGRREISTTLE